MSSRVKRRFWIVILLICVAVLIWLHWNGRLAHPGQSAASASAANATLAATAGELLLDLQDDATPQQVRQLERRFKIRLRPNSVFSAGTQLYRAQVRPGRLRQLLAALRKSPEVELAEPDVTFSIPPLERGQAFSGADQPAASKFPNDPKYKYQWHLDQIQMPKAWPKATGEGVVVAVIDTGVAYKNRGKKFRAVPDLAQTRMVKGYDFVNDNAYPVDDHGHGTHVAGTIAQSTNNRVGVAGVAYRASIMPLKVLSSRGFGSVADIAEAVRFAANHGAKVINMSLGASRGSSILHKAVVYAHKKGVVLVCAAGNNGRGEVSYPAAYPEAIAVAATQYDRTTTFYSNWGEAVDVAAPGGNTRVDQNEDGMPDGVLQNTIVPGKPNQNDYLLFMGTSMASPHVAGVAALVLQSGVTRPEAVRRVLRESATHPEGKSWDPHYGAGIVDAAAAVERASSGLGTMSLGVALLLGLMVIVRQRGRGMWPGQVSLRSPVGPGAGLLLGASGLFFLPALGLSLGPAHLGLPAWELNLWGTATPLGHSALLPLGATALLWSVRRLRGLLFGLCLGVAGHLLVKLALGSVDLWGIPDTLGLESIWLLANAALCVGLAALLARR